MNFNIKETISILERTPDVLDTYLSNLSDDWIMNNEGENTWSPHLVIAHLILGEKTDWIPRAKLMLSDTEDKTFEPFDMVGHYEYSQGKTMEELLAEFRALRKENMETLKSLPINEETLSRKGMHPALGEATLKEHLSTWTVHDLGHIAQISRVMAKQYKDEVGPWGAYLGILK